MNPSLRLALFVPLLAGCKDVQDKLNDYTNPTVIEGMVLGVAQPDFDFDLKGTDFSKGSAAAVFLADAADSSQIQDSPITGADVSLGKLSLTDDGEGKYAITGNDGFTYKAGASLDLAIDTGDTTASATVTAPDAADASIGTTHDANSDLTVDLSDQAFDSALVVVFDVSTGSVTYSNQPTTITDIYTFTHGGAEALTVDVPGSAFPDKTAYAVGVAGLVDATESDYDGANTLLSTYMAGKLKFYPVSTIPAS